MWRFYARVITEGKGAVEIDWNFQWIVHWLLSEQEVQQYIRNLDYNGESLVLCSWLSKGSNK